MTAATVPGPGERRVASVGGRPAVLTQTWADIVWAHWRADPQLVAKLLPPALAVDTFDGSAWVGFVPFEMRDLRVVAAGRRLPGIGSTRSFSEVNVRTYVTGPAGPGVWFHSLDATSALAVGVARGLWRLPYRRAKVASGSAGDERAWSVARVAGRHSAAASGGLRATVGPPVPATSQSDFLCERYRLYAPLGRRLLLSAPVRHRSWRLHAVRLEQLDDGLVRAAGYSPVGPPHSVLAADPVDVTVGAPQVLRSRR